MKHKLFVELKKNNMNLFLKFTILLSLFFSLTFQAQVRNLREDKPKLLFVKDTISKDSLLEYARGFLGCKYRYAQSSCEKGFDCSGFVSHCYKRFGIKLPRSATDYEFIGIDIPKDSCRPGDILVIKGTNANSRVAGHVAIVMKNTGEDFQFIHASSNRTKGGVIISTYKSSPYYEKRFIKIIRVTNCY